MRYAVLGPGKRVRPVLVYATGQALDTPLEELDASAVAVELIHAYSLIHDDLPAMDDDDLRRGRPTCHREFDEATAILAGDALQALAFSAIADCEKITVPPPRRIEMLRALAHASGSEGMAGGQAMDLAAVGNHLTLAELEKNAPVQNRRVNSSECPTRISRESNRRRRYRTASRSLRPLRWARVPGAR